MRYCQNCILPDTRPNLTIQENGFCDPCNSSSSDKKDNIDWDDLQKGSIINENDIRIIRPGYGLSPKYFEQLIGKKLSQPVKKGTPASWELFDDKFK